MLPASLGKIHECKHPHHICFKKTERPHQPNHVTEPDCHRLHKASRLSNQIEIFQKSYRLYELVSVTPSPVGFSEEISSVLDFLVTAEVALFSYLLVSLVEHGGMC